MLPDYDPSRPVLVLAPHFLLPTRHGADVLIEGRWRAFSRNVPEVHVLGCRELIVYRDGTLAQRSPFENRMRSKTMSVLRALAHGSHYLLEKFLTRRYIERARRQLQDERYGTIVSSYLCSADFYGSVRARFDRLSLVETHNDDFAWFSDIARETRNPFIRKAAELSTKWTGDFFRRASQEHLYLHVTEGDRRAYAGHSPNHRSIIAPIGIDLTDELPRHVESDGTVRLLFVGSLGRSMNYDAISYFAERYYPVLEKDLNTTVEVRIAGSGPTRRVRNLCEHMGWSLYADVSDAGLKELYAEASFTLLPFRYATGAKLKVLESLSYGVPFLGTTKVKGQIPSEIWPSLLADEATDWVRHVRNVLSRTLTPEERRRIKEVARPYSWNKIADRLHESLLARAFEPNATER